MTADERFEWDALPSGSPPVSAPLKLNVENQKP